MADDAEDPEDELENRIIRAADVASAAARRLHGVASAILILVTGLSLAVLAAAVGKLLTVDNDSDRAVAGIVAASAVVSWLWIALPCFAAQAIARYVEYRTWAN